MLIDWISLKLPLIHLSSDDRTRLEGNTSRIQKFCPVTGEISWTTAAWESIRSDSHQISYKVGATELYVQGSPARVHQDGCSVFGSGIVAALELEQCAQLMINTMTALTGVKFPVANNWGVTRVDVTQNLLLENLEQVREALSILRDCEGGRYRVSQQAGDSVYWNHTSRLRKGKAYAKGAHLSYQNKNRKYTGKTYNQQEIDQANRLLRLELTLGREFFRRLEMNWQDVPPSFLKNQWHDYFSRMTGQATMTNDSQLTKRVSMAAPTKGYAKATMKTWYAIQSLGWEKAKSLTPKSTWYKHLKILRTAGIGDADLSRGELTPVKMTIIEMTAVNSWQELQQAA